MSMPIMVDNTCRFFQWLKSLALIRNSLSYPKPVTNIDVAAFADTVIRVKPNPGYLPTFDQHEVDRRGFLYLQY